MIHLDLKPCPFCGGPARMKRVESDGITYATGSCRESTCPGNVNNIPPQPEEEAARIWNKRAGT